MSLGLLLKSYAKYCGVLFILSIFLHFPVVVFAQDTKEKPQRPKSEKPVVADFTEEPKPKEGVEQLEDMPVDKPVAEFVDGKPQSQRQYIYESPSLKTLSHLYWAISYLDIENDTHVDNFMKINECDIYKNFFGSEFEWKDIRKAAREFIMANKAEFPTRFELTQEIGLQEYDMKREAFKIDPGYQIQAVRRFEMQASDSTSKVVCMDRSMEIDGYPKGLLLELSRPFSLTFAPAPKDIAIAYIAEKDEILKKWKDKGRTKKRIFDIRKAYIVMQIKIFAHRKLVKNSVGRRALQVMAVLEGYEIYGDVGRKQLFYAKNYVKKKDEQKVSEKLQQEYDIIKAKYKGEGVLH